jgi:O-acetyl-ADP-ribose deacetylase (regulator of RNase III)
VGPNRHRGQDDPALLASCFTSSLEVAHEVGARSVAFPAVSAGAYGWAVDEVAAIAVAAVRRWGTSGGPADLEHVRFVLFGPRAHAAFQRALDS